MNPSAIEGLKKQVRGELLQPSDAGYDEARSVYNAMIDRRPAVVVRPSGTEDVAAAVRFAREQELPLSIRGGGHSISGNAACDGGGMLDMSTLSSTKGAVVDADGVEGGGPALYDFAREEPASPAARPTENWTVRPSALT